MDFKKLIQIKGTKNWLYFLTRVAFTIGLITTGFLALANQQVYAAQSNDDFANEINLSTALSGTISADNFNATIEIAEPELTSSNTNATVWWSWVAPVSGTLVVDTIGSDFDTTLTIFSGSNLSSLTTLAFNDDYSGLVSRASLQVVQGTSYHFRVGGYDTSQGNIVLNWALSAASATSSVSPIAGGQYHTCALSSDGTVKCWGNNAFGQLGNGSNIDANTPVNVQGLNTGVQAISSGAYSSCALSVSTSPASSAVQCWGSNVAGQLGYGTTTSSASPVTVIGLSALTTEITSGNQHACAVSSSGALQCWGSNVAGQLGNGLTTSSSNPVNVADLTNAAAATAGYQHTCALTTTGGVKCWGSNNFGQLGNGTFVDANTPVDVTGLSTGVIAIQAGSYYTCALTNDGAVKCWGNNSNGQLGTGSQTSSNLPVDVAGLSSGMVAITAGDQHSCALSYNGQIQCWGGNAFGQLGNGSLSNSLTPVAIAGDNNGFTAINAGAYHSCAVNNLGEVQCWGYNGFGELGDGTQDTSISPITVSGLNLTRLSQTINFPLIPDHIFGEAPFNISAIASSGLEVSYRATTPLICSVSGNTVTLLNVGVCNIAANQFGDNIYAAASEVNNSFNISAAPQVSSSDGDVPLPNWVLLLMSICLMALIARRKRNF